MAGRLDGDMAARMTTSSGPIVASTCRRCGQKLDAAIDVDGEERPTPGAVSICFYCGTVSLFAEDLALREPTVEEINGLLDDEGVSRILSRLWDVKLAQVIGAGDVLFACGCRTSSGGDLFTLEACSPSCAAAWTVYRMMREEGKMTEGPLTEYRQCVCGRLKQAGFICDFCYSTEQVGPEQGGEEGSAE